MCAGGLGTRLAISCVSCKPSVLVLRARLDRVTIRERKEVEKEEVAVEKEKKRQADLRKKESQRLVANAVAQELQQEQGASSLDKVRSLWRCWMVDVVAM